MTDDRLPQTRKEDTDELLAGLDEFLSGGDSRNQALNESTNEQGTPVQGASSAAEGDFRKLEPFFEAHGTETGAPDAEGSTGAEPDAGQKTADSPTGEHGAAPEAAGWEQNGQWSSSLDSSGTGPTFDHIDNGEGDRGPENESAGFEDSAGIRAEEPAFSTSGEAFASWQATEPPPHGPRASAADHGERSARRWGRIRRPATLLGALGLLTAAGAGWLALDARAAMDGIGERLRQLEDGPVSVASAEGPGAEGGRIAELSRRLDELAAQVKSPGDVAEEGSRAIAELRAQVRSVAERLSGLDERVGGLGLRGAGRSDSAPGPSGNTAAAPPGDWVVNLASFTEQSNARQALARVRQIGIEAEMAPTRLDGRLWYRVRVQGFGNAEAARAYARVEAARAGFDQAWVGRY
mgnify:CR=1 FL=1